MKNYLEIYDTWGLFITNEVLVFRKRSGNFSFSLWSNDIFCMAMIGYFRIKYSNLI